MHVVQQPEVAADAVAVDLAGDSSTGDEHAYAVARPAAALYTPTPGTTIATPGRPAARA